jgi:hypothetical protein
MKNRLFILALLASSFACSTGKHHDEKAEWKELNSFHKVMAEAFHPLKDSGNVGPAKKLADQMAEEAARWASSTLPEKVNTGEMKSNLEKLKAETKALAEEIGKGASDDIIKAKLSSLHHQFHEIMEAWQEGNHHGGDEEEEHEEHEHED